MLILLGVEPPCNKPIGGGAAGARAKDAPTTDAETGTSVDVVMGVAWHAFGSYVGIALAITDAKLMTISVIAMDRGENTNATQPWFHS